MKRLAKRNTGRFARRMKTIKERIGPTTGDWDVQIPDPCYGSTAIAIVQRGQSFGAIIGFAEARPTHSEKEANARLFAASSDMLHAILTTLDSNQVLPGPVYDLLRFAAAKAGVEEFQK